jgi:hypothetical protein
MHGSSTGRAVGAVGNGFAGDGPDELAVAHQAQITLFARLQTAVFVQRRRSAARAIRLLGVGVGVLGLYCTLVHFFSVRLRRLYFNITSKLLGKD